MKKSILIPLVVSLATLFPAHAGPEDDARAIVEMTVTKEVFDSAMSAVAELMAGNIQNEVSKSGQTMSDGAARTVTTMMTDAMASQMVGGMSEPMVQAYVDNHSPEALAAYRAFLESAEGREIAAKIPAMTNEGAAIGERIGLQIGQSAMLGVLADVGADNWPEGTSTTVQRELKTLFAQ